MSTTITEEQLVSRPATDDEPSVLPWIGLLAGLSVVVGGLAAVFWSAVVDLPSYQILTDGSASMAERALTEIVSADAWFVFTGALVGAGLGLVTWKWFRAIGWPTALLAMAAGLVAGVVCWQVGQLLGPGSFPERLATAKPGDLVPISLELRSLPALAVWGFAAITPVLLISSLGPDDEDGAHRRRRRNAEAAVEETHTGTVDERGVLTSTTDAAAE